MRMVVAEVEQGVELGQLVELVGVAMEVAVAKVEEGVLPQLVFVMGVKLIIYIMN